MKLSQQQENNITYRNPLRLTVKNYIQEQDAPKIFSNDEIHGGHISPPSKTEPYFCDMLIKLSKCTLILILQNPLNPLMISSKGHPINSVQQNGRRRIHITIANITYQKLAKNTSSNLLIGMPTDWSENKVSIKTTKRNYFSRR